jgi:hypothetical protein
MKDRCTVLYHYLQKELTLCKKRKLAFEKEVECCFRVSDKYKRCLVEEFKKYEFKTDEEEIEFFKMWKPRFTSEIEYYNLIYHSLLFQPLEIESAFYFWRREYGRLNIFKTDNNLFLECYANEQSELTPYYFLRKYYDFKNILNAKIYDADTFITTNDDSLVSTLLALERYKEYAEEKLGSL